MIEIDEKTMQKIIFYAADLYSQEFGNPDYPFVHFGDQVEQVKQGYIDGWVTDKFLDFATDGLLDETGGSGDE